MKCIFCKLHSLNSKSKEHIIPESLGNKKHILKKGKVCDKCNNYFAIKIEKELLSKQYFKYIRFKNDILNKKNKFVPTKGFINQPLNNKIEVSRSNGKFLNVIVQNNQIFESIINGEVTSLYIPQIFLPKKTI